MKRKKKDKKLQSYQIVAIVVLVGTLLLLEWLTVRTFAEQKFMERQLNTIETAELADAKSYVTNVDIVNETIGKTEITISYPTDESGNRIATIEEELNKHLETLRKEAELQTVSTWVYLKVYQINAFKDVKEVYYYQSVYQENENGIEQTSYQELSHHIVSESSTDNPSIEHLFINDLVATNFFVKKAMTIADEKGLASEQRTTLLQLFANEQWKQLPVSILQNGFRFTLPDSITMSSGERLTEVTVAFQELFNIFKPSEVPESETAAYKNYQAQVAEKLQEKRVAISFDDGPSAETTPQVLDILKRYGVHATFYIMGKHVFGNESIIEQIVKDGHEVGNHSYSHPLLTKKSPEEVHYQIAKTQKLIGDASGGVKPTTLRPPYGGFDAMVAQQAGIALVDWSVDTEDWKSHDPQSILERVKEGSYPGAIILMHDIHQDTVNTVEAILNYLVAEGYQIGSVEELMAHQPMEAGYMYFDRTLKQVAE